MQKAIIYTRVSTDEQAQKGFSLPHQQMILERYCEHNGIEVVRHFQEDHSAKDFERPEFIKLMDLIRANRGMIDIVLFTRWDRFSRNQEASLKIIRELKKYGVEVNSVEQPLDLSQPENKVMLAIYLTIPEVENDKNSLRTIEGMRRAKLEGCWTGIAPIGYKNHRNEAGKSTLIFSDKAPLVREAYEIYSLGVYSLEEVRRHVMKKGLKISKQQFYNMMRAVVYTGRIHVFAHGREEAQVVSGLHEPIVSLQLYDKVQTILSNNRKQPIQKTSKRDELPLRGYLICPKCGNKLTGSGSRSRSGKIHYYYHCQKGCKVRFRADMANNIFEEYLEAIQVDPAVLELYKAILVDLFNKRLSDQGINISNLKAEKSRYAQLKSNAEDRFFANEIDKPTFMNASSRYEKEIIQINGRISELSAIHSGFQKYLNEGLPLLSNLHYHYARVPVEYKQKIVGSIFPGNLVFEDKKYRTAEMSRVLSLIINDTKGRTNETIKKGRPNDQPFLSGSSGRT